MAATKKALAIRAQKNALRAQVAAMNESLKAACSRVPESIVNGSHQVAVAWRDQAEKVVFGTLSIGAKNASTSDLEHLVAVRAQQLQVLQGGAA